MASLAASSLAYNLVGGTDRQKQSTDCSYHALFHISRVTQHRVMSYHKLLQEDRASNESSRRLLLEDVLLGALLLVHVGQHVQTLELLEQPRVRVVSPELQLALLGGGPVAGVTAMSPCIKS